jgi:hypothetical protein
LLKDELIQMFYGFVLRIFIDSKRY